MLDKETFKKQLQKLVNLYPQWKLDIADKEIVSDWYKQFEDYKNEEFIEAVQKYINNEKYFPTIAGIKGKDTKPDFAKPTIVEGTPEEERFLEWYNEQI